MNNFQTMIYQAGYTCRSYSGRSMYDKTCLGVVVNGDISVGEFVANILEAMSTIQDDEDDPIVDQLADAFRIMRSDSMGRGQIFYFPGIAFESESDEETLQKDGKHFRGHEAPAHQPEQQPQ